VRRPDRHISMSRLVFKYTSLSGIYGEVCRHMRIYAGLTYLIYYAGAGEVGLHDLPRSRSGT
jgi:hypothetical protein